MLTLQRASAGSGKTYTLTKKFIRLLISISENGSRPRLRTDVELRDSVSHILAITFTNKATAEMTERIISRLDDLANKADFADPKNTTYLEDYMEEFDASAEDISHACKIVLSQLLFSFSDFNVRTIDTFFQSVLRTFAYESDLPDNYELIIDNKFVTRLIVSSMLDAYNDRTLDRETTQFLAEYIREEMKSKGLSHWNVFNKIEKGNASNKNLFAKLCDISGALESDESKDALAALEDFLESHGSLLEARKKADDYFLGKQIDAFARMREAAQNLITTYSAVFSDALAIEDWEEFIAGKKTFANKLYNKVLAENADPHLTPFSHTPKLRDLSGCFSGFKALQKKAIAPYVDKCAAVFTEFDEAYTLWANTFNTDSFLWSQFRSSITELAILHELSRRLDDLLRENGTLQISSTNRLLNRIIADDDVPFIYERYGTRLNHFLIDEFQDTSLLQWENILPLLNESDSRSNENLIIGDAKQSIYRFRGADPTLITERVPAAFGNCDERGYSVEENSNRRSERRIVEFNNFIFRGASKVLGDGIDTLYSNTVQKPGNSDKLGYTELIFFNKQLKANQEEENSGGQTKIHDIVGSRLGEMIYDMHRRGYLWKEIAIIVISNEAASQAIEYLMDFNRSLPAGAKKIEFVSEEALTLNSSEAVRSVIGCLRMIQTGLEGKLNSDDDSKEKSKSGHLNWSDISGHFRYYSIRNPHLSLQERLEQFLGGDFEGDVIEQILEEMQAVTLPSLVEALTEAFVPGDMRKAEAVYLAAFQDAVLDYCELYPADVGSLLRWWDRHGAKECITSPEGTDAVSIMTIHKSKGLEFECVILPEFDLKFAETGTRQWIDVPEDYPVAEYIPKKLRVNLKTKKENKEQWQKTPYASMINENNYFETIDTLNKGYVAMTRPISELYIFLPLPGAKEEKKFNQIVSRLLDDPVSTIDSFAGDETPMMIDPKLLSRSEYQWDGTEFKNIEDVSAETGEQEEEQEEIATDEIRYSYGKKQAQISKSVIERRKKKESKAEQRVLNDYFVNSDRPLLQYQEENAPKFVIKGDEDRMDPRSEGTLLHAVLEHVEKEEDLAKAFERLRIRGALSRADIPEYYKKLSAALASVRDRRWFDGTYRVLAERPLLKDKTLMHRPDRVMLDNEGNAIVVDYKFGTSENNKEHFKQVSNYMRRLSNALGRKKVKGYLWYINEDKILEVRF